ncbi:MAG TPA: LLM class flavin-dependent oxidoreductase [Candidatus Acidoferrales bacterium]|nr:LLM class flavin-dependent oxidoreductase [Candidatus Acidoferrales bacterium]
MSIFAGELGLQFVTHLANHYTLPELVRLARFGLDKGFKHIWVNDNIRYRGQLVVLTAIASQVSVHLGTAIIVPYFHNPLDVADSLGALSELCEGREISVGIARGDLGQSPQHVDPLKPIAMVSETTRFLRRALAGEEIGYSEYPFLCDFYHLRPGGKFRLAFKARSPFKFYGGGNGPQSLRMCGRVMDGVISSGTYIPMLKAGRLRGMLATADAAARETNAQKRLRKVCELNVSISSNRAKAIEFPKRQVAHSILQWEALAFTTEEYANMGVERAQVLKLKSAFEAGATVEEASKLVTEHMVKTYYAAGTPEEVRDQIIELAGEAGKLGYDHIAFAKLGPDYEEAINLLAEQVVPALR